MERQKVDLLNLRIEALKEDVERLKLIAFPPRPIPSATPLYKTEDEEDVEFMRDTGIVSRDDANRILETLQQDIQEYDTGGYPLP